MKGIHFISLACVYLDLTQGNAATVLLYVHLAFVSTMLCDGKLKQLHVFYNQHYACFLSSMP